MKKSMMNTDAGKIKVITYGCGLDNDDFIYRYANHETIDEDGWEPIYGTDEYKKYTLALVQLHKDQFPSKLDKIPQADMKTIKENPN